MPRPILGRLNPIRALVSQPPTGLSGYVKYDFSWTDMFTCILRGPVLAVLKKLTEIFLSHVNQQFLQGFGWVTALMEAKRIV